MSWNGTSIISSMHKHSVPGPVVVHMDRVEGNTFANPEFHGAIHSVLYAFGMTSALEFSEAIGLSSYIPGSTGETVTLDHLDEFTVSVGDKFRFGQVLAEATSPRIPCRKVNFRMQNERGQKAMQECGRSGIYFRILEAGQISITDRVELVERAKEPLLISDMYRAIVKNEIPSRDFIALAQRNGAPAIFLKKWATLLN